MKLAERIRMSGNIGLAICMVAMLGGCVSDGEVIARNIKKYGTQRERVMTISHDDSCRELTSTLANPESSEFDRMLAIRLLLELDVKHNGLPLDTIAALHRVLGPKKSSTVFDIQSNWAHAGQFPLDVLEGDSWPEYLFRFRVEERVNNEWDFLWFSMRLDDNRPGTELGVGEFEEMLDRRRPPKPLPMRAMYFGAPDGGYIVTRKGIFKPDDVEINE